MPPRSLLVLFVCGFPQSSTYSSCTLRGTVHCVHIALACRIQVQIGVQIEAATPFPHRSSPVQAALRPHSSSIFKLFSTLHLNKIRRLCSLNMHMINILRLIDFMRTNPNPRRSSCSLPLLINMLSMPESNVNSASTPPYSSEHRLLSKPDLTPKFHSTSHLHERGKLCSLIMQYRNLL